MFRSIIAASKFLLFAIWALMIGPLQSILLCFTRGPAAYALPHFWQRGVCRIFGLRVIVEGTPETKQQVMFVANHLSYLDIPVLGSVLPASFIAKKDVSKWPVFGFLSTLQQTAFISRDRKDARTEKNNLSNMVAAGKSLILFPEGTSTDGTDVHPFKSSLFSLATDENGRTMPVQPVTLLLEAIGGQPVPAEPGALRDAYAWHGDIEMAPHLWAFAKGRGATIRLVFHPVLDPAVHNDRKKLAAAAWESVRMETLKSLPAPEHTARVAAQSR